MLVCRHNACLRMGHGHAWKGEAGWCGLTTVLWSGPAQERLCPGQAHAHTRLTLVLRVWYRSRLFSWKSRRHHRKPSRAPWRSPRKAGHRASAACAAPGCFSQTKAPRSRSLPGLPPGSLPSLFFFLFFLFCVFVCLFLSEGNSSNNDDD